ncbi:hypothetical protein SeMB42_g07579, partial [Synchytrium endobioticum]
MQNTELTIARLKPLQASMVNMVSRIYVVVALLSTLTSTCMGQTAHYDLKAALVSCSFGVGQTTATLEMTATSPDMVAPPILVLCAHDQFYRPINMKCATTQPVTNLNYLGPYYLGFQSCVMAQAPAVNQADIGCTVTMSWTDNLIDPMSCDRVSFAGGAYANGTSLVLMKINGADAKVQVTTAGNQQLSPATPPPRPPLPSPSPSLPSSPVIPSIMTSAAASPPPPSPVMPSIIPSAAASPPPPSPVMPSIIPSAAAKPTSAMESKAPSRLPPVLAPPTPSYTPTSVQQ